MNIKNKWNKIKENFKNLFLDLIDLISEIIYKLFDIITPKYIKYRLLLYKVKKHMWTNEYIREFERILQNLVDNNKLKLNYKNNIIEIVKRNSKLGYDKYKWCMKCDKRNTKECNVKLCYSEINNGRPRSFRNKKIQ